MLVQANFGSANNTLELILLNCCNIFIIVTLFTSGINKSLGEKCIKRPQS